MLVPRVSLILFIKVQCVKVFEFLHSIKRDGVVFLVELLAIWKQSCYETLLKAHFGFVEDFGNQESELVDWQADIILRCLVQEIKFKLLKPLDFNFVFGQMGCKSVEPLGGF